VTPVGRSYHIEFAMGVRRLLPGAGSKESITLSIAIRVTVETVATV